MRRLGVAPRQMLEVKEAIRNTRLDEAQRLAGRALSAATVAEVEALVARVARTAP